MTVVRLLLITALLLASCTSFPSSGSTGAGGAAGAAVKVTMADDGKTLTAHVGDRVQVALGEIFNWTLERPDAVVLTQGPQTYLLVRGTQAIWTASSVGTATIRATGTPVCPSGSPCPQLAVRFSATIDVRP